jgi:alpha-galactosidase
VPALFTNKSGMKFRLIPPGEFTMGVTDAEAEAWVKFHQDDQHGGKRALPAHPVRLTRPFYLAERELRYGEFLELMKREPGDQPKHPHHKPEGVLQANCTWFDCIEFCNRLSEREGLTPAYKVAGREVTMTPRATGYRLPTEAEWEFACRAGTTSLWHFGLTAQEARALCDRSVPEGQVYLRARIAAPHPFGLLGIYAGSSEWCWDRYDPRYYRKCADQGVAVDPQGPDSGTARITRGGTAYAIASGDLASINSAARDPQDPIKGVAFAWNGFGRLVLPIPAKGQASHSPGGTRLGEGAVSAASSAAPAVPGKTTKPVKVFILAGDSNMAGRAKVSLLKYQASQAETKKRFQHLLLGGEWVVREDVWIKNFHQKGSLTVGFGQSPDRFGPELEFGHVVGDCFDEQVLLIKTCWGGHDLCRDFRSPSAGLPPQEILEQMRKELQKASASATIADVAKKYGATYRAMLTEVRETLANLGEHFPGYQGQGFEIAGFVWFSGWNDMVVYNPFYAEHLAHFIRDVRGEFNTPNLPFVIGQMGVNGISDPGTNEANFRAAQAEVAGLPEFTGNVKLVATDPFWDHEAHAGWKNGMTKDPARWGKVGSDAPYHYLGSARTFCAIGRAFGEAMIELHRSAGCRSQ